MAVDLFAGAGGLSLGARWAGIDVRFAVEKDPHAARTYHHNHPNTTLIVGDVRRIKSLPDRPSSTHAILFGGPPCQGFSTSNQRTRDPENEDNWLFREFLRLAKAWMPEWVVFENVSGMTDGRGKPYLLQVLKGLGKLGYTTDAWILNAADFGVPQCRKRVFIVGSLNGDLLAPPPPSTGRAVTVWEAISDLPELPNGASFERLPYRPGSPSAYARAMRGELKESSNHLVTESAPRVVRRYRHIPRGGNWESIPARLMRNYANRDRCHTGIYRRLCKDEPSVVIGNYRKNMLIHPLQDRGLSVREAARLQSFPDWYEFQGSIGFQQQQVGDAVPPLLACAVFDHVLRHHGGLRTK